MPLPQEVSRPVDQPVEANQSVETPPAPLQEEYLAESDLSSSDTDLASAGGDDQGESFTETDDTTKAENPPANQEFLESLPEHTRMLLEGHVTSEASLDSNLDASGDVYRSEGTEIAQAGPMSRPGSLAEETAEFEGNLERLGLNGNENLMTAYEQFKQNENIPENVKAQMLNVMNDQAKGVESLPAEVRDQLAEGIASGLNRTNELSRNGGTAERTDDSQPADRPEGDQPAEREAAEANPDPDSPEGELTDCAKDLLKHEAISGDPEAMKGLQDFMNSDIDHEMKMKVLRGYQQAMDSSGGTEHVSNRYQDTMSNLMKHSDGEAHDLDLATMVPQRDTPGEAPDRTPDRPDDGAPEASDRTEEGDKLPEGTEPKNLEEELARFNEHRDELAEHNENFDQDFQKFMGRTDLSDAQKAQMLSDMSDIVEGKTDGSGSDSVDNPATTQERREQIVSGLVNNLGNPEDIDQGANNSCNVTTIEEHMAGKGNGNSDLADDYVAKVKEAALHGTFTAEGQNGEPLTVKLPPGILRGDRESTFDQSTDGARNAASQLFQGGLINHHLHQESGGTRYYDEVTPTGRGDTGERMMVKGPNGEFTDQNVRYADGPKKGQEVRSPMMDAYDVGEAGASVGMKGQFVIAHEDWANRGDSEHVKVVRGQGEELQRQLDQHMEGRQSAILVVHSGDRLFTGTEGMGGAGGGHVTSIYKNGDGSYRLSNQWGSGNDKASVSSADLAGAMDRSDRGSGIPGRGGRRPGLEPGQKDEGIVRSDTDDRFNDSQREEREKEEEERRREEEEAEMRRRAELDPGDGADVGQRATALALMEQARSNWQQAVLDDALGSAQSLEALFRDAQEDYRSLV